ncbi:DEAD-box ATP-dependent RNA helicase 38-like [Macadamia integrifolia]|uniref:DEAD-box ATP-dependent RNA helicase 38-like n=1 Tax=Macadamia integrifolia TaxID=60698 RepID=UPI001C4EE5E2|nr:DEAD-box ATP-dependent RNA helicase 38-like [Macadamia integrifolia]
MDDSNGAADGIENLPKVNPPEVKRSWSDEVDDDEPESALSGSGDKAEELNVSSLAIDENKNVSRFLDDQDDSNIRAVTSGDTPYTSASTFEDLKPSPELLQALYVDMNFERPSKIQAISLRMILTPPHKDLIAQAHNGSGKTTCFVLGMLSRVDPTLKALQALCICPTRELAILSTCCKTWKFFKRWGNIQG